MPTVMRPLAPSDPPVRAHVRALERRSAALAQETFEPRPTAAPPADLPEPMGEPLVLDHDVDPGDDELDAAAARPAIKPSRKAVIQRAVRMNRAGTPAIANLVDDVVLVDDVLADWELLRDAGVDLPTAAARLHLLPKQLVPLLTRALADGDPRGSRVPFARDLEPPRRPRRSLRLGRVLDEHAVAS